MKRVIVDVSPTDQRLYHLENSGAFLGNPANLVWDEGVHGLIPNNLLASLGGLVRQGNQLVVDAAKLSAYQTERAAEQTAKDARNTRVQQAKALLNSLDFSNPLTAAQLTNGLRAVTIILKDVASQI